MAEVEQAEGSLLQRKVGPMPVWVWALVGLAAAWLYAKWRGGKQAAATDTTGAGSSESAASAPEFIIEENLPTVPVTVSPGGGTPSGPITTPTPVPVTSPPGKGPKPPIGGGKPPRQSGGGVVGKPGGTPKAKGAIPYRVREGDTLASIAQSHGTTWQKLFAYNTTPGNRPANTIAELKKRGPSLLFPGEEILIPQ